MIAHLRRFLFGSIRQQLIIGIALVHAVMMTLFVYDLVHRQRDFLHQQTLERAVSLARATAASGTQWVLSNDLIGMEELLHGLATYPDLRYAMILAPDGRVLAHSDALSVGRYLADPVSLQLLSPVRRKRERWSKATTWLMSPIRSGKAARRLAGPASRLVRIARRPASAR
jgi:hypothetical protein